MTKTEAVSRIVANDLYDHLKQVLEARDENAFAEARRALQRAASLGISGTAASPSERRER